MSLRVLPHGLLKTAGTMPNAHASPETLARDAESLARFIRAADGSLAVLTGAGVSADSGIPDYRGPQGIYVRNKNFKPMTYQDFIESHASRQRYWSRSYAGWYKIAGAQPNGSHLALAALRAQNRVSALITQNVDNLHVAASQAISQLPTPTRHSYLELHGTLWRVQCLSCRHSLPRPVFQAMLLAANPSWAQDSLHDDDVDVASSTDSPRARRSSPATPPPLTPPGPSLTTTPLPRAQSTTSTLPTTSPPGSLNVNPDGDVDLQGDFSAVEIPPCPACGTGILKPAVVYFGENLPPATKTSALAMIEASRALLVVGSSLQVYSAFSLAKRARELGREVCLLNWGPTRADSLASARISAGCTPVLSAALKLLS